MPFTVDEFQDLIRLLEQHPEWRADLRRHVLSDELLELPAIVRQLAEQMTALTARVDQLAEQVAGLTARVDQLAEAQVRTEQRLGRLESAVEQLAEAQARTEQRLGRLEAAFERLEGVVERLVEAQGRTETRVGGVEGEVLEARYARRGQAYFSRLARRLRTMDAGVLADLLDDAVGEGRLEAAERHAVLQTDLVLAGRRRDDDAEVYLLAEVSAVIDPHDVERAAERARLLEKLGRTVMPIVAGRQIDAEVALLAREGGVWQVLDGQVTRPGLS